MADDPPRTQRGKAELEIVDDRDVPSMATVAQPSGRPPPNPFGEPPGMPALPASAPAMATLAPSAGSQLPMGAPPEMPRYELGPEIARGGMGRVVEATDTVLGRVVALKEALDSDSDALRRFQREIRITARLEHPAIVPVHDAGSRPGGYPFYVMRKISGRPLEKLVAVADTVGKRLALLPHVVAAAQAIAHAHSRGIIHRDIKPANILVGDYGETILIDWGLAKVIGEPDDPATFIRKPAERDEEDLLRTRAGIVYGTPGFMAPEQLRGQLFDERVDIYALGATLYHLLARRPPHHAKTADAMMKAAIAGPPRPLVVEIPGVPPELSTIVDKALAPELDHRYQTAQELAADLERFLTGQLVAAHHYSTRERVRRFVRKNQVPLVIATAATIVLGFVGVFSVRRIIHERDRADDFAAQTLVEKKQADDARAIAEERADIVLLTQARAKVDSNPTAAIVEAKGLSGKHWREVRSIGLAARAAGVAFELPASPKTTTLEISRGGNHLLAAGEDGVIRMHDLAHRSTREITKLAGSAKATFADADRRILATTGLDLQVIDPGNNVKRTFSLRAEIAQLASAGQVAYWVDRTGSAWQLDLSSGDPSSLGINEPVRAVSASPDGNWVMFAGDTHLWALDRTASTPPTSVFAGETREMQWAGNSHLLAAFLDDEAISVDTSSAPPTMSDHFSVGRRDQVGFLGKELLVGGPKGISLARDARNTRVPLSGPVGLRSSRNGTSITAAGNAVVIVSDDGDQTLHAPSSHITQLEASPTSPFVVAVSGDHLLAWNLDDIRPRRIAGDQPANVGFVDGSHVLASFGSDAPSAWIDLATGKLVEVGHEAALLTVAASPSGNAAVSIDIGHRARLVAPGREPQDLGNLDFARFVDDDHIALASEDGSIELYDLGANRRLLLTKRDGHIVALTAGKGGITAAFRDGTVWHHDIASAAEVTASSKPACSGPLVTADNGDAIFATGSDVRSLHGDAITKLATLPRAIDKLVPHGDGVIAVTADGSAYVVRGQTVSAAISVGPPASVSVSPAGMIVHVVQGKIEVIDADTNQRFILAPPAATPYFYPGISPDGSYVIASTTRGLYAWHLELPAQDKVTAWIAGLTNISVIQNDR